MDKKEYPLEDDDFEEYDEDSDWTPSRDKDDDEDWSECIK